MKKIQLKGKTPRIPKTPKSKKVRPPKGTHRLYRKATVPVVFAVGMALSFGLFGQLPRLAATANDRSLLALMFAGVVAFTAFVAAMYFVGLGLRSVKNSPAGKLGGTREFLAATAIFAAGAVAFVSLRNRADTAVLLWQATVAVGALLGVYTVFVRQAHPYTRDGVNLDDQPGGVEQLEEQLGHQDESSRPEPQPASVAPPPAPQQEQPAPAAPSLVQPAPPLVQPVRLAWPVGEGGRVPEGATLQPVGAPPNGHKPDDWPFGG